MAQGFSGLQPEKKSAKKNEPTFCLAEKLLTIGADSSETRKYYEAKNDCTHNSEQFFCVTDVRGIGKFRAELKVTDLR